MSESAENDVRRDWAALCAAWDTFHASMEKHLGFSKSTPSLIKPDTTAGSTSSPLSSPPAIPIPAVLGGGMLPPLMPGNVPSAPVKAAEPSRPAEPAKPTEAELAAREKAVLNNIQSISDTMTRQVTGIQQGMMTGRLGAHQINAMMADQYNWGIGAFQTLRVEASALSDAGKREALKTLDLFVDDTKKAIGIVGGMVNQQRQFEMNQVNIWNQTTTDLTKAQMDMNAKTSQAFARANEKWSDNF